LRKSAWVYNPRAITDNETEQPEGRNDMTGQDIRIAATEGGDFDCYVSRPASGPAPAVIIMSSVFGVDDDVRRDIDDLAARGFIGAGPDLFWRGDGGPKPRTEEGDRQAKARAKNRAPLIEAGVGDLADVMAHLRGLPECNGKFAVLGLCYGGPFALLGPSRLGVDAGIAFHGSQMQNYLDELPKVQAPLCLHWGDQDVIAPVEVIAQIQQATRDMKDVDITVYPGVPHGYAARSSDAWDEHATSGSWASALKLLDRLRDSAAAPA
jgi:carboxymethylenebutenolidase